MLDNVLVAKNCKTVTKISIKSIVSVLLIAMAVGLPQIVHLVAGAPGGVKWLPMFLPVLIAGCVLGAKWGLMVGALSPIVSFAITSLAGNPMPLATRLPFMIAELMVFALVSGLFSKKLVANKWLAFPAVLLAQVAGRVTFLTLIAIFEKVSPFSVQMIWSQIQTGFIGLIAQAVIVPFVIMGIALLIEKDQKKSETEEYHR